MVKLYPLVLGPYLLRRYGWKAVWPGAVLVAGVSAPYAAPYVVPHVKESVDLYFELFEFNAGPYYAVKEAFAWATGADWSKQIGPAFRGLFLAALPVLYLLDAARNWSFRRAALVTLGLFFALSTTVHPWYLLTILPLAVLPSADSGTEAQSTGFFSAASPSWSWLWLGGASLGTYLFYVDGPYWPWVVAGWGGATVLAGTALFQRSSGSWWKSVDALLQSVQRRRAAKKAGRVVDVLREEGGVSVAGRESPLRVLDLGAGEGYVGAKLRRRLGADVTLADVVDMNRTALPHRVYDGTRLPVKDGAFDVTVLYFVLHHAADPTSVLREALRVTGGRVVVVESVVTGRWQHRLLRLLDRLANRLRSAGEMEAQEEQLSFRRAAEWAELARTLGATVRLERRIAHPIHPQAVYVLEPGAASAEAEDARSSRKTSQTSSGDVVEASSHR
jgi:SAM-dependent methyltransferase